MDISDQEHKERMQKVKAAFGRKQARATREKGLIIVHTGLGKGKTTAALGVAFRALGHGMKIGMVQFIKGAIPTGEQASAQMHPGTMNVFTMGEGYTWDTQDRSRDLQVARRAWEKAVELIQSKKYDLVILDELNVVLKYEYLPLTAVLEALHSKPEQLHVIVTGRHAPKELIEIADLVTEMKVVKHPYSRGIKAQRGIEF